MDTNITNTLFSTVFVAGLATVGLLSHNSNTGPVNLSELLHGSTQSRYEDGFKAKNPLKSSSIAMMGALKYAVFGQAAKGAVVGNDGWLFTTEELETTPEFAKNIQSSADQIARVYADMAARGVHLLPVIVPDKAEVYADQLGVTRVPSVVERRDLLTSALKKHGVAVLDATSALEVVKSQGNAFMQDDTHWSPLGSQAVANAVADRVANIEFTKTEVSTNATGTLIFDGDLLAYVPTGILRPLVGPAQNQIEQFETKVAAGTSLFGDAPVDVVLVGTSFSAKADWHFEGFLKQALQADILNYADEGRGPFAPMEAFMASDTFQYDAPKLVIWEIPARYTSKDQTK